MHWPAPSTGSARTRAYVPATAMSVSVAVNGGVPQYLNNPSTTLTIAADAGVDTFAFATYDEPGGEGNVLSSSSITQTINIGGTNTVSAVLNGVIAKVALTLSSAHPNAGVPTTVNVNATAQDADGNTIVGAGGYNTPIKLAMAIPTTSEVGAASLSTAVLQNPTQTATLNYTGGTLSTATVSASATGVTTVNAAFAPTPTFYQFSLPTATNRPRWIAPGSDGNMWFTENPGGAIGRITPAGVVTEFTIPTTSSLPQQIIGASDGNLWFTEFTAAGKSAVAKVTTSGTFTEYQTLFAPPPTDDPLGLVDRGDGNIWYVANGSSRVGFQGMTSGVAGETAIPTSNSGPFGIATAPDNNLYYTENATDKIGRIANLFTAQSEIALTAGTGPEGIVRGPDGNLWFAENGSGKIGRMSPSSFFVTGEFPTVTPNSAPVSLVVGQDGAIWFTESGLNSIGRITMDGTVTEFASPVSGLALAGIGVAPDGSLWFAEPGSGLNPGAIGKLVY